MRKMITGAAMKTVVISAGLLMGFGSGVAYAEPTPVEPSVSASPVVEPAPAGKDTIFIASSGLGEEHHVSKGLTVEEAMAEIGAPLGELDQPSAPADSLVKDAQFITVSRMRLDSVEKNVVDKFSSSKQAGLVSCAGDWDEPRIVTPGVNGERVESWARVIVDSKVQSEMKVSEVVNKKKVDEVVAECAPKPKPSPKPSPSPTVASPEPVVEVSSAPKNGASESSQSAADKPTTVVSGSKQDWMKAAGIAESDWGYVDFIVNKESSWNPKAVNASSGACGLVQSLPCSKIGPNWDDPVTALKWQKNYVEQRYGGYAGAHSFWLKNSWY